MSRGQRCPSCGEELPDGSPRGLCPRCLLRVGLEEDSASVPRNGGTAATGLGVLDTIAPTCGPVPRVLLRDTAPGEEPGPIVTQPDEADADRSIRYRIDGEIARGGMGAVLKGRDPDLGRDVALKVLREDHPRQRRHGPPVRRGGPDRRPAPAPRHRADLRAGHLRRPPAVLQHEAGQGAHAGASCSARLATGSRPTTCPAFLSIFEAICQTVAYAHARGVIHRDLKPSNVMVGSVRRGAGDGLGPGQGPAPRRCRRRRPGRQAGAPGDRDRHGPQRLGRPDLSQAGSVMGTPSYMAPEQARGEIDRIDERADVFALGSILCEILTGEPAFTGRSSAEILRKAARGDLADALARLDACGADAELIALAKDCLAPSRRTARDMPASWPGG